jgi:hypothetical protein
MPIKHSTSDYQRAVEQSGGNIRVWRGEAHYLHTTVMMDSTDGHVYWNLNPSIPMEEQPVIRESGRVIRAGYEYTPIEWEYETHKGLCLREYERNGYHDSDFYMVVWNDEKNAPESIEFATTRAGCGAAFGSHPDATPEVKAKYEAYQQEQARRAEEERQSFLAAQPGKGKTLKVVRGRKVPIGTIGVCFWLGRREYGVRVGIKDQAGNVHWTAATNVEVVQ